MTAVTLARDAGLLHSVESSLNFEEKILCLESVLRPIVAVRFTTPPERQRQK